MSRTLPHAPCDRRLIAPKPRIGFLGVGWIGASRLRSLVDADVCEVACIVDEDSGAVERSRELAPRAHVGTRFDDLLDMELDGVVIATPSAMHADQALAALERGCAVFCQKPLARTADEARRVVEAARRFDRLLGVDLSYRYTEAFRQVLSRVHAGEVGEVFAADLTFHNAYGPDKPWFRDVTLSGGGCVIDLGIHLVDLALVALDWPRIERVESHLFQGGRRLVGPPTVVEDFASATISTDAGQCIRLACSWNLHAGQDAVIAATLYGERGAAGIANVNGSFYDFHAMLDRGTQRQLLWTGPDDWGGRAAVAWARRLAEHPGFDPEAERFVDAAQVIDRIYHR